MNRNASHGVIAVTDNLILWTLLRTDFNENTELVTAAVYSALSCSHGVTVTDRIELAFH